MHHPSSCLPKDNCLGREFPWWLGSTSDLMFAHASTRTLIHTSISHPEPIETWQISLRVKHDRNGVTRTPTPTHFPSSFLDSGIMSPTEWRRIWRRGVFHFCALAAIYWKNVAITRSSLNSPAVVKYQQFVSLLWPSAELHTSKTSQQLIYSGLRGLTRHCRFKFVILWPWCYREHTLFRTLEGPFLLLSKIDTGVHSDFSMTKE